MRCTLLIHQGTTPTPRTDGWDELSPAEQAEVYEAYKRLDETPGEVFRDEGPRRAALAGLLGAARCGVASGRRVALGELRLLDPDRDEPTGEHQLYGIGVVGLPKPRRWLRVRTFATFPGELLGRRAPGPLGGGGRAASRASRAGGGARHERAG